KDFNLNLDNLKTEKDNLQIENKKLKEFTRNPNYEIKEKGYIAKLNSLEQRINILQKNRDSLAGLVANFQLNIVEADKLNAVKDKKRIFGYGYDYHRLDLSRKN
ncbi:hypothetical protein, partial [Segetibacter sp.]|uniref:hypothetical protein n=1 Tax=Segetibacter sp. TaxID=2231182 RepID=UPI002606C7AF